MGIAITQVDAFTSKPFAGNPAAVCILSEAPEERWMRDVAREMNLSETAFLVPLDGEYNLRWFTPAVEVDLCGHATLASAHVLWEEGHLAAGAQARFHTRSGLLLAERQGDWIEMDFPAKMETAAEPPADLADVMGQAQARFAVEVAAAGAHHLMLTGPPGVGKTMLAQRLPGLLPQLSDGESLEVTAIHSVAGLLSDATPLITRPPFVAPHHSSSVAALVGGGSGMARPGAVSRAHRGVLFLDECAEIGVSALEALRTPLEEGEIRLARRDGVACYPARFQLVLAANPCPCAPADPRDCICAAAVKRRYLGRLSGPLLDRVDLRVEMHPVRMSAFATTDAESTAQVRHRVTVARDAAAQRWRAHGFRTNAEVSGTLLRRRFRPSTVAMQPLRTALDRGLLSIRGVDRTMRVAWTLADLAGRTSPGRDEVAVALSFRQPGASR